MSTSIPIYQRRRAIRLTAFIGLLVPSLAVLCAEDQPAAWQLTLHPQASAAVFDVQQDAVLTATVRHIRDGDSAAKLIYSVANSDGQTLDNGEVAVAMAAGETRQIDLRVGRAESLPHEQSLSVTVSLVPTSGTPIVWRKHFGFLPRRTSVAAPEASPFGLLTDGDWPLMQRLGVRFVRPNWSWSERPMDWARRYGIAYCALLNESNAFVRGELSENEYYDFVFESVSRFKGYVRYWQMGNEFDIFHRNGPRQYVESQRIGFAAAKAADPACVVIGGSITELQCRREGWAESLQAGLSQYCDIYDFHFYQDLSTTQDLLDYIHATCRQSQAEKPIWVTETAQVGMFDPDDANQADFIIKRHAQLLANDVSVVMWHCFRWPYAFEADPVAATGMVDHDGFARPALFAYAALTRTMEGAKFIRRWEAGKDMYAYEFARGDRSLLILWSEAGDLAMRCTAPRGAVTALEPCGRRTVLPAAEPSGFNVTASKSPVVYELPGPATEVTTVF